MKPLKQALILFKENVVAGTIRAPDNYPAWDTLGYAGHRADLVSLWSEIKPRLKRDIDHAAFIDAKLSDALASFDRSEREPGQSLMVEIYNVLNLNELR